VPEPLLDTSIFIDLFRSSLDADRYIGTWLRSGRLVLHAAVAAELAAGIRSRAEQNQLDKLCDQARMLIPTGADWTLALRLMRTHSRTAGTDWVDCLIAASAMRLRLPVATLNEKHFMPIKKLLVIRPY
jgi:predicted nucleic acid-binding protein